MFNYDSEDEVPKGENGDCYDCNGSGFDSEGGQCHTCFGSGDLDD